MKKRISKLEIRNFKTIEVLEVDIDPEGNVIQIGGGNGDGKTTWMDAIEATLGGKRGICSEPIKRGEDKAFVRTTLSDGMVSERTFTPEKSVLTLTRESGAVQKSPQKFLDERWSAASADPLKFSRDEPAMRLSALREFSGVDFTELDDKYDGAFEKRKNLKKDLKQAEAEFRALPFHKEAPEEELDKSTQLKIMKDAEAARDEAAQAHLEAQELGSKLAQLRADRDSLQQSIKLAKEDLKRMEDEAETYPVHIGAAKDEHSAAIDLAAKRADQVPDTEEIAAMLSHMDETNQQVRENQARAAVEKEVGLYKEQIAECDGILKGIKGEKSQLLSKAKLPVPGIGFGDKDVTINDLPWDQASGAERLRTSIAMALALNSEIAVLLVRDASLIDKNSMLMIKEMADDADAQIFLEVVRDDDSVQFVMENGAVRE